MTRYQCAKCGKVCGNAGAYKTHAKSCTRVVESPSLMKFITKRAVKKAPIELKPIHRKKPKQSKLSALARPQIQKIKPASGIFFRGGWGTFFKATLMSIIEVQHVFLIMNIDDLHRLGRV